MELSFLDLKAKEVINTGDGKSLGNVSDLVFTYPDGVICGIVVPGRKGFRLFKCRCNDMFIDLCHVKKIGNDVVLVDLRFGDRRDDCRRISDCKPPRNPPPRKPEPRDAFDLPRIDENDYE